MASRLSGSPRVRGPMPRRSNASSIWRILVRIWHELALPGAVVGFGEGPSVGTRGSERTVSGQTDQGPNSTVPGMVWCLVFRPNGSRLHNLLCKPSEGRNRAKAETRETKPKTTTLKDPTPRARRAFQQTMRNKWAVTPPSTLVGHLRDTSAVLYPLICRADGQLSVTECC